MEKTITVEVFEDIAEDIHSAYREKIIVEEELARITQANKPAGKNTALRFEELEEAISYAGMHAWRQNVGARIKELAGELYDAGFPKDVIVRYKDIGIKLTGDGRTKASLSLEKWPEKRA